MKTSAVKFQFISIIFLLVFSFPLFSQKKKEIKKFKIKSCLVTETQGSKTITDSKAVYDAIGRLIEETNYDENGIFIALKKYTYNKSGEINTEQKFNQSNQLIESSSFKYNIKNQKTEENVFNSKKQLIRKIYYLYNSNGLKIEKRTNDAQGRMISIKKFQYSFY